MQAGVYFLFHLFTFFGFICSIQDLDMEIRYKKLKKHIDFSENVCYNT